MYTADYTMRYMGVEKQSLSGMKNNMEKISIVVPVYNAEKYLCEAIESVLKQTFRELELLLINDRSSDRSKEICLDYSKKDDRIVYLENDTQVHGPGPTRNIGLDSATGVYIFFMDADDWIDERLLECAVARMQETGADIVRVGVKHELGDGKEALEYLWKGKPVLHKTDTGANPASCWKGTDLFLWANLFRKETVRTIRFEHFINGEDLCYLIDALINAETVAFTNEVYYHYRYVPGSTSGRWNCDMIACRGEIWDRQRRFLDSFPGQVDQSNYAKAAYENYTWALRRLIEPVCQLPYQKRKRELFQLRDRMDFDSYRNRYPFKTERGLLRVKLLLVKYRLEWLILLLGSILYGKAG